MRRLLRGVVLPLAALAAGTIGCSRLDPPWAQPPSSVGAPVVHVLDGGDATVSTVAFGSGAASFAGYVPIEGVPERILADPQHRWVFAFSSNQVSVLAVDAESGRTSLRSVQPLPTLRDVAFSAGRLVALHDDELHLYDVADSGTLVLAGVVNAGSSDVVAVRADGRFAYAAGDSRIHAFRLTDAGPVALAELSLPESDENAAAGLVVSADGATLVLAFGSSSRLLAFEVDPTNGRLGALQDEVLLPATATALQAGEGDVVFAADAAGNLSAFAGSSLDLLHRVNTGAVPSALAFDAGAVSVASRASNVVSRHRFDRAGGFAAEGSTRVRGEPISIAAAGAQVTPAARFAYVASREGHDVSVLELSDEGLALVATLPFAEPPEALAVDSTGRMLLVAAGALYAFVLDADSGIPEAAGAPVLEGTKPVAISVDPSGRFVFVASDTGDDLHTVSLDPETGALTPIGAQPVSQKPTGIAADPTGRFVYTACDAGMTGLSIHSVDPRTGALHADGGSDDSAENGHRSVVVDPTGQFVLRAHAGRNDVRSFPIDAHDGSLFAGATTLQDAEPQAIAVAPGGNVAWVANRLGASVATFRIEPTGALAPLAVSDAGMPVSIAVSADGRYVFVADESRGVSAFLADPVTGALDPVATVAMSAPPTGIVLAAPPR